MMQMQIEIEAVLFLSLVACFRLFSVDDDPHFITHFRHHSFRQIASHYPSNDNQRGRLSLSFDVNSLDKINATLLTAVCVISLVKQ